jgi:hypothetical protein
VTASGRWRSTRRVDREVDDRSLSLSHVSEGAVLAGLAMRETETDGQRQAVCLTLYQV